MAFYPVDTSLPVSIVKLREVSYGVSVCRLKSGNYAVTVHTGDTRAIVDLTHDELRDFIARISAFVA